MNSSFPDRDASGDPLAAISPLDGRYRGQIGDIAPYVSEAALIRYRLVIEVEWLIEQTEIVALDGARRLAAAELEQLRGLVEQFGIAEARQVKEIEWRTRHDVKALELFLADRLEALGLGELRGHVHFGCTSEDINNLAYGLMLRDVIWNVWIPAAAELAATVATMALQVKGSPLLSRTHGQPATPTTLGKELAVFVARWERQIASLREVRMRGKFNGAAGTFSAHSLAYPEVPWPDASRAFVERLGLEWAPLTTQVEPHDYVAEIAHHLVRFNSIVADFAADMWLYVGAGLFTQQTRAEEVGSSTMPHKSNPIRFENAEANVGISNALFEHLARKLPISRLQRDLSDSSTLRNLGVAFAHSLLAIRSASDGIGVLEPNEAAMRAELARSWEVLAEALQTVARRYGDSTAYDLLKRQTRGVPTGAGDIRAAIEALHLPDGDRERLIALTPETYTGLAEVLVDEYLPEIMGG